MRRPLVARWGSAWGITPSPWWGCYPSWENASCSRANTALSPGKLSGTSRPWQPKWPGCFCEPCHCDASSSFLLTFPKALMCRLHGEHFAHLQWFSTFVFCFRTFFNQVTVDWVAQNRTWASLVLIRLAARLTVVLMLSLNYLGDAGDGLRGCYLQRSDLEGKLKENLKSWWGRAQL